MRAPRTARSANTRAPRTDRAAILSDVLFVRTTTDWLSTLHRGILTAHMRFQRAEFGKFRTITPKSLIARQ